MSPASPEFCSPRPPLIERHDDSILCTACRFQAHGAFLFHGSRICISIDGDSVCPFRYFCIAAVSSGGGGGVGVGWHT
jgi:hypothetical protein